MTPSRRAGCARPDNRPRLNGGGVPQSRGVPPGGAPADLFRPLHSSGAGPGGETPALHGRRDARRHLAQVR